MAQPSDTDAPAQPEKKQSLAKRSMIAAGFGYIGSKVGFLGMLKDADSLLKDQNLTLGGKIKALYNGTVIKALRKKAAEVMKAENIGRVRAYMKVCKYSTLSTGIGLAAGIALGWVTGGRINDWREIVVHPEDSTKILFDAEPKDEKKTEASAAPIIASEPNATKWQAHVRTAHPPTSQPEISL